MIYPDKLTNFQIINDDRGKTTLIQAADLGEPEKYTDRLLDTARLESWRASHQHRTPSARCARGWRTGDLA
ncbi:hypothetical protein KUV57_11715 [Epibacterium sp. DP7N7-1]|nr:hypothetical protein [Epibacterium sp. DP7N7-1]